MAKVWSSDGGHSRIVWSHFLFLKGDNCLLILEVSFWDDRDCLRWTFQGQKSHACTQ
jgi:hypothetical protein